MIKINTEFSAKNNSAFVANDCDHSLKSILRNSYCDDIYR